MRDNEKLHQISSYGQWVEWILRRISYDIRFALQLRKDIWHTYVHAHMRRCTFMWGKETRK